MKGDFMNHPFIILLIKKNTRYKIIIFFITKTIFDIFAKLIFLCAL